MFDTESALKYVTWDAPIGEKDSVGIWHIRVDVDKDGITHQICPHYKPPRVPTVVLLGDFACMGCKHYIGRSNREKLLLCSHPSTEFKREFATDEDLKERLTFLSENRFFLSAH